MFRIPRFVVVALAVVVAIVGSCVAAQAQTGSCPTTNTLEANPTWICVAPSSVAAHNVAPDPLNSQSVARYDLLFFGPGIDSATGTPTSTINIGKPALNAQGVMWLQRSELQSIPLGQRYTARAVAVNPNGTASVRSPESNPFGRSTTGAPAAPATVVAVP